MLSSLSRKDIWERFCLIFSSCSWSVLNSFWTFESTVLSFSFLKEFKFARPKSICFWESKSFTCFLRTNLLSDLFLVLFLLDVLCFCLELFWFTFWWFLLDFLKYLLIFLGLKLSCILLEFLEICMTKSGFRVLFCL